MHTQGERERERRRKDFVNIRKSSGMGELLYLCMNVDWPVLPWRPDKGSATAGARFPSSELQQDYGTAAYQL